MSILHGRFGLFYTNQPIMVFLTDNVVFSIFLHFKDTKFLLNVYRQYDSIRRLAHARPNTLFSHARVIDRMPSDRLLLATLSDPTCPNINLDKLFVDVVHRDYRLTCKFLLAADKVDPAADNNAAFWWAVARGDIELVGLLLDTDEVDPAANDNKALIQASTHGYTDIVKLLLNTNEVDPAAKDNAALWGAIIHDHTEIVRLLLDTNKVGSSAIDKACNWTYTDNTEIIRLLRDANKRALVAADLEPF
jgi:ankyrin repeat protein